MPCLDFFGKQSLHPPDLWYSLRLPAASSVWQVTLGVQASLTENYLISWIMVIRPLTDCLLRPWPFIVFANSICSDYDSICQDCRMIDQHERILCRRGSHKNSHSLSCEATSLVTASLMVTWLVKISLSFWHFQFWSVWSTHASNSTAHQKRSLVPHASVLPKFLYSCSLQGQLAASARSSQFP